jgi:hypothetical protein
MKCLAELHVTLGSSGFFFGSRRHANDGQNKGSEEWHHKLQDYDFLIPLTNLRLLSLNCGSQISRNHHFNFVNITRDWQAQQAVLRSQAMTEKPLSFARHFAQLTNLQRLTVCGNSLTSVTEEVEHLQALWELNLAENAIHSVSPSIV